MGGTFGLRACYPHSPGGERRCVFQSSQPRRFANENSVTPPAVGFREMGRGRAADAAMLLRVALRARLRGSPCSHFEPGLGVQTIGSRVRQPDALITGTKFPLAARLAPDVRVVFEALSLTFGRTGRIEKVREYAAMPSMRRYVMLGTMSAGLLVLYRQHAGEGWAATALTIEDTLGLPDIGTDIPDTEFYEDMDFTDMPAGRRPGCAIERCALRSPGQSGVARFAAAQIWTTPLPSCGRGAMIGPVCDHAGATGCTTPPTTRAADQAPPTAAARAPKTAPRATNSPAATPTAPFRLPAARCKSRPAPRPAGGRRTMPPRPGRPG